MSKFAASYKTLIALYKLTDFSSTTGFGSCCLASTNTEDCLAVSKKSSNMAPKGSEWQEEARSRAEAKKTHVSFPQLKYPSLRDQGFRDPGQWLEGKAMDDGAEGLWRVHDGLYDVSDFVKRHPGGEEWLELTKGTDITEAFEVHHLSPSVPQLLQKFYIRPAKTPRNSPFTFHEDGFYKTLKAKVIEELKKVPKHTPRYADLITDGLFATMVISAAAACWLTDAWLVNLSWLVSGLSMCWLAVCSHNYIHRRSNWRMYLFNFTLWPYRDFRVSHALSHHLYPNTLMDLEISMFEPMFPWNPRKKGIYAKFAFFVEMLLFPALFLIGLFKRVYMMLTREGFYKQQVRWHDFLGLMLPVPMWLLSGCSFGEAFYMWLWINMTASFLFHLIGLNAAHHHPEIFHDGDEAKSQTPDWGMHELEAVMDRNDITGSLFRVMTFFGDHALHHLFPTLDHAVLPYLYPVFLEHCKKYRANFRMTSSFDLFIGQIKQLVRSEVRIVKND